LTTVGLYNVAVELRKAPVNPYVALATGPYRVVVEARTGNAMVAVPGVTVEPYSTAVELRNGATRLCDWLIDPVYRVVVALMNGATSG
jgi:hypothetical protein